MYYKISESSRPRLDSTNVKVAMANGELAPCLGQGRLKLEFQVKEQSKVISQDVYLADIEPEGILGYDFLETYDCTLNLGKGEMQIGGQQVRCHVYRASAEKCTRVIADRTITIKAGEEILLPGKLKHRNRNSKFGIVEPEPRFVRNHEVMVAKTLVDVQQELVPIRVLNLKDEAIIIYQGAVLATCEPVESGEIVQEKEGRRVTILQENKQASEKEIPEHLTELFKISGERLNPSQKMQLSRVLTTFQDVFAKTQVIWARLQLSSTR